MANEDEVHTVTVNEKDCYPLVEKIVQIFKDDDVDEVTAYVTLKIMMEQLEKDLDVRGCTVTNLHEN
jgi:hypothetical protein